MARAGKDKEGSQSRTSMVALPISRTPFSLLRLPAKGKGEAHGRGWSCRWRARVPGADGVACAIWWQVRWGTPTYADGELVRRRKRCQEGGRPLARLLVGAEAKDAIVHGIFIASQPVGCDEKHVLLRHVERRDSRHVSNDLAFCLALPVCNVHEPKRPLGRRRSLRVKLGVLRTCQFGAQEGERLGG